MSTISRRAVVIHLLLLLQMILASESIWDSSGKAFKVQEESLPFILTESVIKVGLGSSDDKSVVAPSKGFNFAEDIKKLEEAKKVLERFEAAESAIESQFAKPTANEATTKDTIDTASSDFESKRRQGKVNGLFRHPRLRAPIYRQQVDFDDSSSDSQAVPPSSSESQPPKRQSFEGELKSENQNLLSSNEKPSLLLTMGGYQRPFEIKRLQPKLPESQTTESTTENNPKTGGGNVNTIIVPHVRYEDRSPPLLKIPGMGYQPPVEDSRPKEEKEPAPSIFSPYAQFTQSFYPSSNQIPNLNDPMIAKLQSNSMNSYPASFNEFHRPNPNSFFLNQPVPANSYGVNNPFNYPSGLPYTSPNLQSNPFQNFGFQTNGGGNAIAARTVPNDPNAISPNYFDGSNLPTQMNPQDSPYSIYQNVFPTQMYQPPRFPLNSNIQNYPVGNDRKTEITEQESESVSREQHQDSPPPDTQYLNYPSQNAGYGQMEVLPVQNRTTPSAHPISPAGRLYPHHFYSGMYPYQHLYPQEQRPYGFQSVYEQPQAQPTTPDLSKAPHESRNTSQIADEYFKYLRSPFPFPISSNPDNRDSGLFFPYPVGEAAGRHIPGFSHPTATSGEKDNVTASTEKTMHIPLASFFQFFSSRSPANRAKINPDVVPDCAKEDNATICFEDKDYPKSDVMFMLDTHKPMMHRLLPFSSASELAEENLADSSSDADICQVDIKHGFPQRAVDTNGKWKVIVNVDGDERFKAFSQSVRLELCSKTDQPCNHTDKTFDTQCVQKHSLQRLLTWDHERGLHVGLFRLPVACACQVVKPPTST